MNADGFLGTGWFICEAIFERKGYSWREECEWGVGSGVETVEKRRQ